LFLSGEQENHLNLLQSHRGGFKMIFRYPNFELIKTLTNFPKPPHTTSSRLHPLHLSLLFSRVIRTPEII